MSNTYNIFISHSWAYSDGYEKLIKLLDGKAYFSYKDYSVPKDDPIHTRGSAEELIKAITNKMSSCHAIIIMAGVYSSYSKWIKKEINIANNTFNTKKPIIAIKPWGNINVSEVVSENSDILVGWNTDSIVDAIRNYSL